MKSLRGPGKKSFEMNVDMMDALKEEKEEPGQPFKMGGKSLDDPSLRGGSSSVPVSHAIENV